MKKSLNIIWLASIVILSGCSLSNDNVEKVSSVNKGPESIMEEKAVDTNNNPILLTEEKTGFTKFDNNQLSIELSMTDINVLSEKEKEGLAYMREEEKLAYDLYKALDNKWNQNIFNNISSSELTHTNAVKSLIEKYSLPDPALKEEGKFSNPSLQELFDQLFAKGSQSLTEGLKVGALVEEVDIIDLKNHIKETDNEDIIMVYENLMKGSRNHLRAFVRNLKKNGVVYEPKKLNQTEFNKIIDSDIERGAGKQRRGRQ